MLMKGDFLWIMSYSKITLFLVLSCSLMEVGECVGCFNFPNSFMDCLISIFVRFILVLEELLNKPFHRTLGYE